MARSRDDGYVSVNTENSGKELKQGSLKVPTGAAFTVEDEEFGRAYTVREDVYLYDGIPPKQRINRSPNLTEENQIYPCDGPNKTIFAGELNKNQEVIAR